VVQTLLDQGADANAVSRFYGNVLQAAAGGGQERLVQMLRDREAPNVGTAAVVEPGTRR
jgi:hypothetical protein